MQKGSRFLLSGISLNKVMSQAPPTRRRWFQFGLRELFWLALVVALGLYCLGERDRRVRSEAEAVILRGEVSALKAAVAKAQKEGIDGQHKWVTEIRRLERESHNKASLP